MLGMMSYASVLPWTALVEIMDFGEPYINADSSTGNKYHWCKMPRAGDVVHMGGRW